MLQHKQIRMKPIATFVFTDTDDIDYEEQEEVYHDQFATFMKQNPSLKEVACIAIKTGYTHRLIERKDVMDPAPAVVFTDKIWEPTLQPVINDRSIYDLVRRAGIKYGTCVFDCKSAEEVLDRITDLGYADYCGCCDIENVIDIRWYLVDDKLVLKCTMDCESG